MVERKDIEERYKKRKMVNNSSGYSGTTNWDTWEAMNMIKSFGSIQEKWERLGENFNEEIRNGTFNEEKAKDSLRKKVLEKVKKQDEFNVLNINKVNMDELVDETILMNKPSASREKDNHPRSEKRRREKMAEKKRKITKKDRKINAREI